MNNNSLFDRLDAVRGLMADAASRSGRKVEEISLVAVSKTHPPESVIEALDAGQLIFGESRVQEARAKIPLIPARARWHFVGHLQKNKIRHALPLFEMLHGVDSLELARYIDRIAGECGAFPHVLVEVNVAGEGTKFGFAPDLLRAQMEELLALGRLNIDGLMCIPPADEAPGPHFALLRKIAHRHGLEVLSMGMSGDYETAIRFGATHVRVGSSLFGERKPSETP